MKKILIFFAAGCLGGIANVLVSWQLGAQGITSSWGVAIAPALTSAYLYARLSWGGFWGLFFLLPFMNSRLLLKGTLLSLLPSLIQLFVIFPQAGQGVLGLHLGPLTPLVVLIFNWVWGIVAALAIKSAR